MNSARAQELLEIVRSGYNEIAANFDVTRKKALWPEIYEFAASVKDGDKVLDLACGNGRLLEALMDKKISYLGVDNSIELLNLARRNYPDNKFIVSDILTLDNLESQKFNHIFCLAVLQHIPSRELRIKALKNMAAKLTNGGRLVISNWNLFTKVKYRRTLFKRYFLKFLGFNKDDWNDLVFPWKDSSGQEKGLRYYHAFTGRELRQLVGEAGLKINNYQKDAYNFWLEIVK